MAERAYTVAEVDRMRQVISYRYPSPIWSTPISGGHSTKINDHTAQIEEVLRTYLVAGVDPAELVK